MKRSVRRGGVAFLAVAPVAVWLTSWKIEEARFSPFTLEFQKRRSFVVFTGEVPVYRSDWEPSPNDVLMYIARAKFVEPIPTEDPHWNLVHRFKAGQEGGWHRPFHTLKPELVAWSERHPEVAPLFWQAGYNLVRSDSENEIEAGYQLMGCFWEHCESVSDLKRVLMILEEVHRVDFKDKVPAALVEAKLEPSKSKMLEGKVTSQALTERLNKSGNKTDAKAKPAPKSPKKTKVTTPPAQ